MSFEKIARDYVTAMSDAIARGHGQSAYDVSTKTIELALESFIGAIRAADVCEGCKAKLAPELEKTRAGLDEVEFNEGDSGRPLHPSEGQPVVCQDCKGKGWIRGACTTRPVRVKCEACGGTGRP